MTDRDAELVERIAARFAKAVEDDPELAAGMDAMLAGMACRARRLFLEHEEHMPDATPSEFRGSMKRCSGSERMRPPGWPEGEEE